MIPRGIFLLACAAAAFAQAPAVRHFDLAVFQAPPAAFRGHAMWSFPLNNLNERYVVSGIEEMARLNYGGFFIEAGGLPRPGVPNTGTAPAVGFLSDEYFRYYQLALEGRRRNTSKSSSMTITLFPPAPWLANSPPGTPSTWPRA